MSTTTPYADLGKDGNDLFKTGFPVSGERTQTWRQASSVQISHEAPVNGSLLKTSVLQGPKGVNLTFQPEYKWRLGTFPAVAKAKCDTNGLIEGSLAVSDIGTAGTEVTPWAKVEQKDCAQISGGLQLRFANDLVHFSAKTDTPADLSQHKCTANFVAQFPPSIYWGVNFQYTHTANADALKSDGPAKDVNFKLHYPRSDSAFTLGFETNPKSEQKELSFTWFQTVSDALKAATQFTLPVEGVPTVSVAAAHKWDSATTVKGKLSVGKEARLGLSYSQTVTPFATAVIGADLNANRLVGYGNGADHSFGLEVKLK